MASHYVRGEAFSSEYSLGVLGVYDFGDSHVPPVFLIGSRNFDVSFSFSFCAWVVDLVCPVFARRWIALVAGHKTSGYPLGGLDKG